MQWNEPDKDEFGHKPNITGKLVGIPRQLYTMIEKRQAITQYDLCPSTGWWHKQIWDM